MRASSRVKLCLDVAGCAIKKLQNDSEMANEHTTQTVYSNEGDPSLMVTTAPLPMPHNPASVLYWLKALLDPRHSECRIELALLGDAFVRLARTLNAILPVVALEGQ